MKLFVLIVLLLTSLNAQKEENDMQIVVDRNHKQFLTSSEVSLLFFFTPQCGHCERFQPDVEKAAKMLKDEGIIFGKVDGHNYKDVAKTYGVTGYPTLLYLENYGKKYTKFEGSRTADSIVMWVYDKLNPGSQELSTVEDIKQKIDTLDCVFLFISPSPDERSLNRYLEFSHMYKNVNFVHTFIPQVQKELGISDLAQFVVFKKYDKSPIIYQPRQFKQADMRAFVDTNIIPKLSEYNLDIKKKMTKQDRTVILLMLDGESSMKDQNAIDAVNKVALEYPSEEYVLFIKATPETLLYQELVDHIGDNSDRPQLFGLNRNGTYKYKLAKSIQKNNIEQFVRDVLTGKGQRHYKSQILEKINLTQYVQILNGLSYQWMLSSKEDRVILYYNSFDKEHQEVIEQFMEVAAQIGSKSTIKFAITDASKNEYPDFQDEINIAKVRLYKQKEFQKFILKANKIQTERLVKFIMENSSYEFEEPKQRHDDL